MTQPSTSMKVNIFFADPASAVHASSWVVPLKQLDAHNKSLASSVTRLSKFIQIEAHDQLVLKAKRLFAQY